MTPHSGEVTLLSPANQADIGKNEGHSAVAPSLSAHRRIVSGANDEFELNHVLATLVEALNQLSNKSGRAIVHLPSASSTPRSA